MVRAKPAAFQTNDMGQTSSQVHQPSATEVAMEDREMSSDKKRKPKKSKRRSVEAEHPLDAEEESARALLQMRGVGVDDDSRAPYYGDDLAASQQLLPESSPMRSPISSSMNPTTKKSSKHSRKSEKKGKKQRPTSSTLLSGSEERNPGNRYPQLPSTPPEQADHPSSPPYRPGFSQSQHALDDILTDEETAVFEEEFGNGAASAGPTVTDHDIFSFSQHPPDALSQLDEMYPTHRLPTQIYASPKSSERIRKHKRGPTSAFDSANGEYMSSANGAGQHTFQFDYHPDNEHFNYPLNLADQLGDHEDHEMPIDPELHSMSALPPSVDLSAPDDDQTNSSGTKRRKAIPNGLSKPRKRRRLEEMQPVNVEPEPYYSPYTMQDEQENIQDHVLPGLEDMQRQSSPELGTPYMEDIAREGLEYLDNTSKPAKLSRRKKPKEDTTKALPNQHTSVQKDKQSNHSIKDVSEKGGPFSQAEITKLDNFRERYCDANKMNHAHFNSLIQAPMRGNSEVTALFNELHEVLPYRPRMSVQKFVRRHFHNFPARGTWTSEEDEMLRRAVAEKGKQWKAVGEMIDRMPGDCRDRWRNYLLNSEHRNREQWTDAEVRNLCLAILECMQLMKDARRLEREEKYGLGDPEADEDSDQDVEDMKVINWQAVSDRMGEHGGGRSRLQCSFKWGQLKKKEQNDLLKSVRDEGESEPKGPGPTKNPWRHVRAAKKVANMKTGDKYVFLQAILESNAPVDGNIPWKALGDDNFRATWNAADKRTAWSTMKETVPGSDSMDYREVVNRLLTSLLAEGADKLDERWDPNVHGDVSRPKPRKSKRASGKQREVDGVKSKPEGRYRKDREKKAGMKSHEYIEESEEEVAGAIIGPQNHESNNALPTSAEAYRYPNMIEEAALNTAGSEERQGEIEDDHVSDRDSLFDEPIEESEHAPRNERELSPEMVSKVHMLVNV